MIPTPRPQLFTDIGDAAPREVVTRNASGGNGAYGIKLELQGSRMAAQRLLLRTALQELDTLDEALRRVIESRQGYQPSFVGLSQQEAARACTRLQARQVHCEIVDS